MRAARTLTVLRLLTKRKHFTPILLILLAFPAAALAAGGEAASSERVAVDQAEVAPLAPLKQPVHRFHRVIKTIAADIRADERAAALRRERESEERFAALGVSMATLESIAAC